MADKKYTYYKEGNAALSKSINQYLRQRDKIVNVMWNTKLLPILKQTQNDVITKLKAYDNLTDWQVYNMKRIQASIGETIERMEMQITRELQLAQLKMIKFDNASAIKQFRAAKIADDMALILSKEVTDSLLAMSAEFMTYFSKDMTKIIMSDISLGLVRGESVASVAKTITDKFGLTSKQISLYNSDKARWDSYLSQGKVSQKRYDRRIGYLNNQLSKGSMMSYARAERIAKTEILRAASFARQERFSEIAELNDNVVKVWIHAGASPDSRDTHLEAEAIYKANPIKADDLFYEGGETGMYPKDISFSAKNTVNCACMHLLLNKEYMT